MKCEICKCETDVEATYCCSGDECSCLGQPTNEGSILCDTCKEHVEYLENHKASVFTEDGDQIYVED